MLFYRIFFRFVALSLAAPGFAQTIPIAQARNLALGSFVTVRGIVTNGYELGKARFFQDGTAGIAAYPGPGSVPGFESDVATGDSVEITGVLSDYYGLLEISPVTAFQVIERNKPLPTPKNVSFPEISEELEGQLIATDCATFLNKGSYFSEAGTYTAVDPGGASGIIYFRAENTVLGHEIPEAPVRVEGILSQYGEYQILPRSVADLKPASCFHFVRQPDQSEIGNDGFRIDWQTNMPATAILTYGITNGPVLSIPVAVPANNQSVSLEHLQPGTAYWVQVTAVNDQDSLLSATRFFATRSLSSGRIKVFFNQGINLAAANGLRPDGDNFQAVLSETIARIDAAQLTIDVAMYNNNRSDLTYALRMAQARGLRVRYIAASSTENQALQPAPNFPVLYGNDEGIMHNKFMVIDAGLPEAAWVMSGSLNWTSGNMVQDYNNTLFIQDQSLARAYETEFEEMWGGSGPAPDHAKSRFGSTKTDNNPHYFIIGGRPVESWFSPSDKTTKRIAGAIKTANHQAAFAIFSFTNDDIGNAFVNRHESGVWVRGIMENIGDPGAEMGWLQANGVPISAHPADALMHHKYAVMDAGYELSDPTVATGSHNWTYSAETVNDENTLVLHDDTLAILYQAEFERRWAETTTAADEPFHSSIFSVFPNPNFGSAWIRSDREEPWSGKLEIRNGVGQLMETRMLNGSPTAYVNLAPYPAGLYFLQLHTDHGTASFPVQTLSR